MLLVGQPACMLCTLLILQLLPRCAGAWHLQDQIHRPDNAEQRCGELCKPPAAVHWLPLCMPASAGCLTLMPSGQVFGLFLGAGSLLQCGRQ